jgi:hypothetical protein
MEINELTVAEVGNHIGTTTDAARKRLKRYGFEPARYIGVNAMFKLSAKDLEFLKQCNKRGRPWDKKETSAPKEKPKKAAKKSD